MTLNKNMCFLPGLWNSAVFYWPPVYLILSNESGHFRRRYIWGIMWILAIMLLLEAGFTCVEQLCHCMEFGWGDNILQKLVSSPNRKKKKKFSIFVLSSALPVKWQIQPLETAEWRAFTENDVCHMFVGDNPYVESCDKCALYFASGQV